MIEQSVEHRILELSRKVNSILDKYKRAIAILECLSLLQEITIEFCEKFIHSPGDFNAEGYSEEAKQDILNNAMAINLHGQNMALQGLFLTDDNRDINYTKIFNFLDSMITSDQLVIYQMITLFHQHTQPEGTQHD